VYFWISDTNRFLLGISSFSPVSLITEFLRKVSQLLPLGYILFGLSELGNIQSLLGQSRRDAGD
jgi:hypothetical protein